MEPFTGSVLVLQHLLRKREQPREPVDPVADGDRKSGDILAPPSRCGLGTHLQDLGKVIIFYVQGLLDVLQREKRKPLLDLLHP